MDVGNSRDRAGYAALAAALAALVAAVMYWRTLLPVFDLGDTGSFQTVVSDPLILPRHAYPLYFALGKLLIAVTRLDPPFAMNLLSAIFGAAAVAAFAWLAWELTGSALAGLWTGLLLAGSYTFWSQAIIAEVYSLELFFDAVVFIAAIRWWKRPGYGRLAWLYVWYALSFGNHLSMILLMPALVWLLWKRGARDAAVRRQVFGPAGLLLAATIATAGAMQYAWNFGGLWAETAPRPPFSELASTWWFDVTKSDWRENLVGTVLPKQYAERLAMYRWDLRQQFGIAGIVLSICGVVALGIESGALAAALVLGYLATVLFGFFYNVGDTHVFLLPSHVFVALFAGCAIAWLMNRAREVHGLIVPAIVALVTLALPAWRIGDTWPAVDRSADRRPVVVSEQMLSGLGASNTLYIGNQDWQIENAVGCYLYQYRPEVPRTTTAAVLWHLPEVVRANAAMGRDVVLTRDAADVVRSAYGPLWQIVPDPRSQPPTIAGTLALAPGTPYVLSVLAPLWFMPVDRADLDRALKEVGAPLVGRKHYAVVAGVVGRPPDVFIESDRPFRVSRRIAGLRFDIRIDAWIPFDTMRRAGFGHVIVNRRHAFTIERGVGVAAFSSSGETIRWAYPAGGIFSQLPRYLIPAASVRTP